MNNNLYTIQDIQDRTNLKIDFIRRCTSQLKDVLKPYIKNGEFNTLLIDSNGLVIFDQIMQYKEQGLSLPTIKDKLSSSLLNLQQPTEPENKNYKTLNNPMDNVLVHELISEIKSSREGFLSIQNQLTKAYETLIEKEKLIENQKNQLLLLTDGRPAEQVKNEIINKEVNYKMLTLKTQELEEKYKDQVESAEKNKIVINTIEKDLSEKKSQLNILETEFKETKNSLSEKENKLAEIEQQKNLVELELEKKHQEQIESENKKSELLKKLEDLEGKWFVGNKRKELLKQFQ